MVSEGRDLLGEVEFIDYVAAELQLDPSTIQPTSRLRDDIGLDSLGMTVLLVVVRELGADLEDLHVQNLITVQDVFELYRSAGPPNPATTPGGSLRGVLRPSAPATAPLSSPLVTLRPPRPNIDTEFLFELTTGEATGWRWRFRGRTPNRDEYMQVMWKNTQSQYIVTERNQRQKIGLLQAIRPSADGYIYVTAICSETYMGTGLMFEALGLFITFLFTNWNYHHVYAEVPEYNYEAFRSGEGSIFEVRGHFVDHDYAKGQFWDMFVVGVARDVWMLCVAPRFLAAVQAAPGR